MANTINLRVKGKKNHLLELKYKVVNKNVKNILHFVSRDFRRLTREISSIEQGEDSRLL